MLVANDSGGNNLLAVPDKMSGKVITLSDISFSLSDIVCRREL